MSNTLIVRQIRKNWFEVLVLVIFVYFITGSLLGLTRQIESFTRSTRIFHKAGLENVLFYSTSTLSHSDSKILSECSEIRNVPGVAKIGLTSTATLFTPEGEIGFRLFISDSDDLNKVRYPLSAGDYPRFGESNHVLLPPFFKQYFTVGDHVEMYYYNKENFYTDTYPTVRITVSGFLAEDRQLSFSKSSPNIDVGHLFETLPYTGVAYGLVDASGQPVQLNYGRYIIISPENSEDIRQLKNDITDVVQSKDFVHIGEDMVNRYWQRHSDQIRALFISTLSLFFLVFSFLLAGTYLSLVSGRKEMAVMHLSGLPWRSCIHLAMMPKIMAIFTGFCVGTLRFIVQSGFNFESSLDNYIRWSDVLITLGSLILLLFAGTFIFYYSALRQSPVALYRKD